MAKFKVGDRVAFAGKPDGESLEGLIVDVDYSVFYAPYVIAVDAGLGYKTAKVWRPVRDLTLLVPPKPKTIPARNLSGKHIGRVVTITTKSGAVVTDELSMVGHSEDGVTAILKSVSPEGSFVRGQGFDIDPDSEVIVK